MPPRVLELRLSYVWTETTPTLLRGTDPQAPMAFLGDTKLYADKYQKIHAWLKGLYDQRKAQARQLAIQYGGNSRTLTMKKAALDADLCKQLNDPAALTPPWIWLGENYKHYFWQYYLENTEPNNLIGARAWEFLVPFRSALPFRIRSPWQGEVPRIKAIADALYYPHGQVFSLVLRLAFTKSEDGGGPGASLARVMERVMDLENCNLPVLTPEGNIEQLHLPTLGSRVLNYLRERALGPGAPQGDRPTAPIIIATVVRGSDADPQQAIAENGELHRVLEGLCSRKGTWETEQKLRPLKDANLLVSDSTPGHIVYHLPRARAVWMPLYFTAPSASDQHKLGCYHRNLTWVTLQSEMLAQAAALYANRQDEGQPITPAMQDLAHNAVVRLGILYAALRKQGKKQTYNSASPRAYLIENDYVDTVNRVRRGFNLPMPDLTWKQWP